MIEKLRMCCIDSAGRASRRGWGKSADCRTFCGCTRLVRRTVLAGPNAADPMGRGTGARPECWILSQEAIRALTFSAKGRTVRGNPDVEDRKSVVSGKSVSVRVDLGG